MIMRMLPQPPLDGGGGVLRFGSVEPTISDSE